MNSPQIKSDQLYTYEDYCNWSEDEHWELIDGVAYPLHGEMHAAPARTHQDVVVQLLFQIAGYLKGKPCKVYVAPFDVRFSKKDHKHKKKDTVVQPDIAIICDKEKLDEKGCNGAPDWIIEVISPNSASRDHIQKRALYEEQGVKEYWLVHPIDKIVTLYHFEKSSNSQIIAAEGQTPSFIFPDLMIDWNEVFV